MPDKSTIPKKSVPLVPAFITLGLAGGAAAFASQFYRHPTGTLNTLLRTHMLLTGAREEICDVRGLLLRRASDMCHRRKPQKRWRRLFSKMPVNEIPTDRIFQNRRCNP
ncbi:MAG TPA: hypothetical protein VNG51_07960 [Ktedonobacteraceae bacterium]|nr:hypothetical protein [Ktedonobacteraceae bacterium]